MEGGSVDKSWLYDNQMSHAALSELTALQRLFDLSEIHCYAGVVDRPISRTWGSMRASLLTITGSDLNVSASNPEITFVWGNGSTSA